MSDVPALLASCRSAPGDLTARGALQDRIRDSDGDTPATDAAGKLCCERCGCPDFAEVMFRDVVGGLWRASEIESMNSDLGFLLFGDEPTTPVGGPLCAYHHGRWHVVCVTCRPKLVAAKAHATRRANRPDPADLPGSLFAGTP